jgi:hypothetical protein
VRRTLFAVLVLLLTLSSAVAAEDTTKPGTFTFASELLFAGVGTSPDQVLDRIMLTQDYLYKSGDEQFSVYGFVEWSGRDAVVFTNHVVSWTPDELFGLRAEFGADDKGGSFVKVGPRLTFAPRGFAHLQIAPLFISGTPEESGELLIYWVTEKLDLTVRGREYSVHSTGFMRTLRNGEKTKSYGQPQIVVTPKGSRFSYVVEAEVAGDVQRYRGGVTVRFPKK